MSKITDIVIVTSLDEDERTGGVWYLNSLLRDTMEHSFGGLSHGPLLEVSDHAGGNKTFCGHLYAASINYLNVEEFISWAVEAPWNHPATVQLLIQEEDDCGFRRIDLTPPLKRDLPDDDQRRLNKARAVLERSGYRLRDGTWIGDRISITDEQVKEMTFLWGDVFLNAVKGKGH